MSSAGLCIYSPTSPLFGGSLVRERPRDRYRLSPVEALSTHVSTARTDLDSPVERGTPEDFVDRELVAATLSLQRVEARVVAKEAALLVRVAETRGFVRLGCSSPGDFALEVLRMDARTLRNRVGLGRVLASRAGVREAFLAGEISACQALLLRPVMDDANEAEWIGRCAVLSVRELAVAVREARGRDHSAGSLETDLFADVDAVVAETRSIAFTAPVSVRVAWDLALETARMSLGWTAPVHACVEAILAEAAPGECPETPLPPDVPKPGGTLSRLAAGGSRKVRGSDGASATDEMQVDPCRRALRTLSAVSELLAHVRDLIDEAPSDEPHVLLARIRSLQSLERPVRVLFGRVLSHLIETRAIYRLGYLRVRDFLEERLHLSERAARDLVRETEIFADCPPIEAAWSSGRIGLRQALLIDRVAPRGLVPAFIARAESVTLRQFAREMRVVEKLRDLGLHRYVEPFPHPSLETAILRRLRKLGWEDARLAEVLGRWDGSVVWSRRRGAAAARARRRGADAGAAITEPPGRARSGTQAAADPAVKDPAFDPLLMRRIEVMVNLLLLSTFENAAERWDDLVLAGADRQTFSATVALLDPAGVSGAAVGWDGAGAHSGGLPDGDRQTFSAVVPGLSDSPITTIRFTAPEPIARHWKGAIATIRRALGPVPDWVCVLALLRDAVSTWTLHDPESVPVRRRILERDGYLCAVPGCSNRRNLEVHHVAFRSQGGDNSDDNLVTLCHAHHQHGVHEGAIRVTGRAPHELSWELGVRRGLPPVLRLKGEMIS